MSRRQGDDELAPRRRVSPLFVLMAFLIVAVLILSIVVPIVSNGR